MDARMDETVQHCGEQHHFIGKCRFHLTTFINDVCVSTVGAYFPTSRPDRMETIGLDRYYETMVFRTNGDWSVKNLGEEGEYAHPDIIDFGEDIGNADLPFGYVNSDLANNGHTTHVEYWLGQSSQISG